MSSTSDRSDRRPLRYEPYEDLDGRPNVIVDGSPTDGTVLSLSHWPNLTTPDGLEADLSAQMALAYLDRFDLHGDAELVSNNHFDQDGLMSVFALVEPDAALARRDLVSDVASAGDFGTYRDRAAARVSMVIGAYADPERSPLTAAETAGDARSRTAILYEELLGRLPDLLDNPGRYRRMWQTEDATLSASEELVKSGDVDIDVVADLDLAIFTIPERAPSSGGHRFGGMWRFGLHPMALNNATDCFALLTIRGRCYEFSYRYETWVQYQSRKPRRRVDLSHLAEELTAEEPGDARWVCEDASGLIPRLYLDGADESVVPPAEFRSRLVAHLRMSPVAWDPYARKVTL